MRVGFVGLGRLGCHMARNLAVAGHQILLWNRSPEKAERLAQAIGYKVASTPQRWQVVRVCFGL
ncbi:MULTISPECIES: NAD(P)-binding domain-containing protein [Falsihalocynthiibacter]|uniref:NAD(P)-binding domain-containing protein n=1 Tax=Falsihalocynthiibacter TaxID=2854182 RepID=UPI0030038E80